MMSISQTSRAGPKQWIGLAVIALPCMLYAMDLTVLNLALPAISEQFNPTGPQLLWIVDIYGFLVAGALIPMGTLGDRIGRRKLLLCGAAFFAAASMIAAFSKSTGMLIVTRAVMGLAGATLAPSTLSLIRNMFLDAEQRTFAIGVWITSYSVGGAIGPLLGGLLLEHFWWGSVFLLSVPVMALLLILGPILLPEYRDPDATPPDVLSAFLSLIAVLSVIYGIKQIAQRGPGSFPILAVMIGVTVGILFVRRQRALSNPLIDLRLFQSRAFNMSLTVYLLGTLIIFGLFVFIAQYLQLVRGLSALQSGFWMLPSFAGFILGSLLCPFLIRRISHAGVISGGLCLGAVGFGLVLMFGPHSGPALVMSAMGIYSLGLAPVFTLTTDLVVSAAPPAKAGAASALSETSSELGGALGIAVLGSLGTYVYRHAMEGTAWNYLPPSARETIGGAVVAAQHMGGNSGAEFLMQSQNAFVKGLHIVALTNILIALAMAIATIKGMRLNPASKS